MVHGCFVQKKLKILLITITFIISGTITFAETTEQNKTKPYFKTLKQRLAKDGFYSPYLDTLFDNKEITFDSEGIGLFFVHNEGSLDYESFANKTSIWRAGKYLKKHDRHFTSVEKNFGVDKTVITAIILVETGLGTYMGKRLVINTLSTMAAIADPDVKELLWESIKDKNRLPRAKFDVKAAKKSAWAYNELKAFITYVNREKLDPHTMYGSYAGAMGIAQFMPSNILSFAKDGNGDGRVNLLNHSDAITSIASYLKHYGWHAEIEKNKAEEVLFEYNHSSYYVDILMRISELLKGKNG